MSDPLADLRAARDARADAEDAVAEYGEATLERLREAYEDAVSLLAGYEESATGTGDFEAYVEFEGRVAELVDGIDDALPRADAFERYDDALDKRRLSPADFERARDALDPVADLVERLEARADALDEYGRARRAAVERRDELDAEIERLERVARLADADPDAPVADLRGPIEAYDDAAHEAVADALANQPSEAVLGWLTDLDAFPLVDAPRVPPGLLDYVRAYEAGDEPVDVLLEYADESISKLEHYVAEPAALKRVVGANRSFLRRLDGDFLALGWPPAPADVLRYRADGLVSALSRIGADEAVERLRDVQALARTDRYERLRESALARTELSEAERERVADGTVEDALAEARAERERIDATLDDG